MSLLTNTAVVVFDLDNTLIDRQRAFVRWLSDFLRCHLTTDHHDRRQVMRHLLRVDDGGRTSRHEVYREISAQVNQVVSPHDIGKQVVQELYRYVRPDERVQNLLKRIVGEKRVALATNGSVINQQRKLTSAMLNEVPWELVAISQALGVSKPHREFFDSVRRGLRQPPESLLMVGDDWDRDIQGASEAGWKTCWVSWGRYLPKHGQAPTMVVQDVFELTGMSEAVADDPTAMDTDVTPAVLLDSKR